jgi:predicted CopG family antitoxin
MSIKMLEKKFPQISVNQTTYIKLNNLKFELRARSYNDVLKALIDEHRKKEVSVK